MEPAVPTSAADNGLATTAPRTQLGPDPASAAAGVGAIAQAPTIQGLVAALLPPHAYFERERGESKRWTWTTPRGVWTISAPGTVAVLRNFIATRGPGLVVTLVGPNGVRVDLPPTERGFEALRTLLHVLGAIGPGSAS